MIRVAILGATGYTALELMKLLLRHPEVEITTLTSRQTDRPHVGTVHPQLVGRLDVHLENLAPEELVSRADCVFSCLPHAASATVVHRLLDAGLSVVDFSADYRINDLDVYTHWYDTKHPDPARVGKVPYGLPELFREQIKGAKMIANPGCFPTSAILALAPLLKANVIDPKSLIVDSKTGVSGAGRKPKLNFHYPECNESISAYNVGRHRHMPEIDQVLSTACGQEVQCVFTPHLVPMDRGILTTTYSHPTTDVTEESLLAIMRVVKSGDLSPDPGVTKNDCMRRAVLESTSTWLARVNTV